MYWPIEAFFLRGEWLRQACAGVFMPALQYISRIGDLTSERLPLGAIEAGAKKRPGVASFYSDPKFFGGLCGLQLHPSPMAATVYFGRVSTLNLMDFKKGLIYVRYRSIGDRIIIKRRFKLSALVPQG